jgi:hypothetical protein
MDPITTSAIVSGIGGIAGTIFGNRGRKKAEERDRAWQEKMYKRQYEDNLELWRLQNQYNTPLAQMGRLKQAGLNPNLIYGKGTGGGQAGLPKSPEVGAVQAREPSYAGAIGAISSYMDIKAKQAQIENLNQATQKSMDDSVLDWFEATGDMRFAKEGNVNWYKTKRKHYKRELGMSQADYNKANKAYRDKVNQAYNKVLESKLRFESAGSDLRELERDIFKGLNAGKGVGDLVVRLVQALMMKKGR